MSILLIINIIIINARFHSISSFNLHINQLFLINLQILCLLCRINKVYGHKKFAKFSCKNEVFCKENKLNVQKRKCFIFVYELLPKTSILFVTGTLTSFVFIYDTQINLTNTDINNEENE